MNDANITPLPMMPAVVLDNCFLPRPLMRKPTNGKKGISQINSKILFISLIRQPAALLFPPLRAGLLLVK